MGSCFRNPRSNLTYTTPVEKAKTDTSGVTSSHQESYATSKDTDTALDKLRYDGLYITSHSDCNEFLRFFPTGEVLAVPCTGTDADVSQIITWLLPGRGFGEGRVTQNSSSLSFRTVSDGGAVDYMGEISGDGSLYLWSYSHINGYRSGREVYRFVFDLSPFLA